MSLNKSAVPIVAAALLAGPTLALGALPQNATLSAVPASKQVDFEVFLPLRNTTSLEKLLQAQQTKGSPSYRQWLTPAQFGARFGPTPDTLAKAQAALIAAGLPVTEVHTRSLHVTTTAAQAAKAFQTSFQMVKNADGSQHMVAVTKLTIPGSLALYGVSVPAFARVPAHQVHSRRVAIPVSDQFGKAAAGGVTPDNRRGAAGGYYFDDLKQAYDYPSYLSITPAGKRLIGDGVRVAILMEDLASNSDVADMYANENYTAVTGKAPPQFAITAVDGGGVKDGPGTFEASLDTQEVTGGAPGARVTLVSIPNLADQHILDGYVKIVDSNEFDIVSSSFGGCELDYTAAYNNGVDYTGVFQIYHEVFEQGNAQGTTFVASSGDSGGLACPSPDYFYGGQHPKFVPSVENPASDPAVTGVGGTNVVTTAPPNPQTTPPTLTSAYVTENAFGDKEIPYDVYGIGTNVSGGYWGAGGGQSVIFPQPSYQYGTNTNSQGRTVPDVGMQVGGCPGGIAKLPCGPDRSFVIVWVDGGKYGLIGTSVAAPEFAGALALYVQNEGGRVGNINPYLYEKGLVQNDFGGRYASPIVQFFHTRINGFDGYWSEYTPAGFGYNYYVGNGTPDVRKLFGMTNYEAAGVPQSTSNP
jgi:subtilase family serine protease